MPKCGSQCWFCDLPVRYDTYKGCSHGCKYCFVQRKSKISKIEPGEGLKPLKEFVEGRRTETTKAFDWNIPLHIGGMSDPFQPCEETQERTYNALKYLAETGYPFVISTKGELICAKKYTDVLKDCNCAVQISMVGSSYDKLEPGAPTFERRLEMLRAVSPICKRAIVRIQPYFHEVLNEVIENMPRYAEAGAYGVIVEGMKFITAKPGLVKVAGDFVYPVQTLKGDFEKIKGCAHENGLVFLCGENRLRQMGDSLTCCGVEGLEGFAPNKYNLAHLLNGDKQKPTKKMLEKGTAYCFKACEQDVFSSADLKQSSFAERLAAYATKKEKYVRQVLGK